MTLSDITNKVLVDWNGDGMFSHALSNISNYVKSTSIKLGRHDETQLVSAVGRCSIVLDNSSRLFSPLYPAGALYGKLLPRRRVKVFTVQGGIEYPAFSGWIESIKPDSGTRLKRECEIECVDLLAILQGHSLSMPVLRNVRSDVAILHVLNTVFNQPKASGTITYASNPTAGATVSVNGTVYTFRTTVGSTANEVLIGGNLAATLNYLALAVNGEGTTVQVYGTNTAQPAYVKASYGGGSAITFIYQLPGTVGNSATLSASSGTVTAFTGGVNASGFALDIGNMTFDYVGDKWGNERTNALRAIQDIVASEYGVFEIGKDGIAHFRNRDFIAYQSNKPVDLAAGYEMMPRGDIDIATVKNRVVVSLTPRGSLSSGVLAKSNDPIAVPGNSTRTVNLKFTDPVSGQNVAADNLVLPLIPVTDWQAGEQSAGDNSGVYNNYNWLSFTYTNKGTSLDVTITNRATGTLKIFGLQVRGLGITQFQETKLVAEDVASQTAYQVRNMQVMIPLSTDPNVGQSLADYLLGHYKVPVFEVASVAFGNRTSIAGVVLQSLDLRDVITFSDDQTGISPTIRYEIIGIDQSVDLGNQVSLSVTLARLGNANEVLGLWDDALWDDALWTI